MPGSRECPSRGKLLGCGLLPLSRAGRRHTSPRRSINDMDIRRSIYQSVYRDLIGPQGDAQEVTTNRPSDQYLTGILYPLVTQTKSDDEEEERQSEDDDRDSGDESDGSP